MLSAFDVIDVNFTFIAVQPLGGASESTMTTKKQKFLNYSKPLANTNHVSAHGRL